VRRKRVNRENTYLDCDFAGEFDGYEMRLGSIRAAQEVSTIEIYKRIFWAHCQNVSGSLSRRHSTPKPNLNDDTDHLAREEMSGQGKVGGFLSAG
jgi:hypothetical protein